MGPTKNLSLLPLLLITLTVLTTLPLSSDATSSTPTPIKPPYTTLTPLLSSLGFHDLSVASHALSLSSTPSSPFISPITVFAPSDTSLRTCPTCSLTSLLQEHTIPGLYSLPYLRTLPFSTKLPSILPGRCLTLTSSSPPRVFISGVEITHPDLYNGHGIIIHGIQGYITHLSPYSCSIDSITSLLLPLPPSLSPPAFLTRMMLADAMIRLRTSGYTILALAMHVKFHDLASLSNMTIFAVDDTAIFHGGHSYVQSVRFHIVPNRLLRLSDLESLPAATSLPTFELGESLTVTNPGGGGILSPLRINYVRIRCPDMIHNLKVVVHGLNSPFPRVTLTRRATSSPTTTTTNPTVADGQGKGTVYPSAGQGQQSAYVSGGATTTTTTTTAEKSTTTTTVPAATSSAALPSTTPVPDQTSTDGTTTAAVVTPDDHVDYIDDVHHGL